MIFAAEPSRNMSLPAKSRVNAANSANGISFFILLLVRASGDINAVIPRIIRMLNMLDPMTLPTAMSALPCAAERKLTTISGVEVPMPTIVIPIMKSEMPKRLAMALAPSTRKLAPKRISARPAISKRMSIIFRR